MNRYVLRKPINIAILIAILAPSVVWAQANERLRTRELGIQVGVFPTGVHNAITDVSGVQVGHSTVVQAPNVRTGVTAILPHAENAYMSRVPAALHVGNGYGKLLGVTQVRELGELETPILLTCTLCVWKAADAMVEWMLGQTGMENVRSLNAFVGETNDGRLNDIRSRPIEPEHVFAALESASGGPVAEGGVGAGAGTVAFGWKGGIGTSSRVLPSSLGGYTVGVLVQSNFGGILQIGGAPVGKELGQYAFANQVGHDDEYDPDTDLQEWGSIMIVVATDAPLSDRNLERIARRAIMGLSRTGSYASNGSGDYVIAFSTSEQVRRSTEDGIHRYSDLSNSNVSALFEATLEATEEAIYNSLFMAESVTSNGRTIQALPIEQTVDILRRYRVIR
ncbi:MAG TPA: aminopeptidase [Gemmatimonadetes bacterium]|nr:aminopeptidase [Gemmatimonadota bacterium]|tara:strand:- start:367 stop:1548 length:1182 start_codon:yes stop_codon:yes gene_type:complete